MAGGNGPIQGMETLISAVFPNHSKALPVGFKPAMHVVGAKVTPHPTIHSPFPQWAHLHYKLLTHPQSLQ